MKRGVGVKGILLYLRVFKCRLRRVEYDVFRCRFYNGVNVFDCGRLFLVEM